MRNQHPSITANGPPDGIGVSSKAYISFAMSRAAARRLQLSRGGLMIFFPTIGVSSRKWEVIFSSSFFPIHMIHM